MSLGLTGADWPVLLLPFPQDTIQVVALAVRHEEATHVVLCLVPHDLGDGLEVLAEVPHRWDRRSSSKYTSGFNIMIL